MTFADIQQGVRSNIQSMAERCRDTFLKDIVADLSSCELQDKFDRRAKRELEELADMNAASHRALVRKKGTEPSCCMHNRLECPTTFPLSSTQSIRFY